MQVESQPPKCVICGEELPPNCFTHDGTGYYDDPDILTIAKVYAGEPYHGSIADIDLECIDFAHPDCYQKLLGVNKKLSDAERIGELVLDSLVDNLRPPFLLIETPAATNEELERWKEVLGDLSSYNMIVHTNEVKVKVLPKPADIHIKALPPVKKEFPEWLELTPMVCPQCSALVRPPFEHCEYCGVHFAQKIRDLKVINNKALLIAEKHYVGYPTGAYNVSVSSNGFLDNFYVDINWMISTLKELGEDVTKPMDLVISPDQFLLLKRTQLTDRPISMLEFTENYLKGAIYVPENCFDILPKYKENVMVLTVQGGRNAAYIDNITLKE